MKTLTIQLTANETVTLTYSERAECWDLFSGNIALLRQMAENIGWVYAERREKLGDFAARNKDLFIVTEKSVSTTELWVN